MDDVNDKRKRAFTDLYMNAGQSQIAEFSVKQYECNTDRNNEKQNPIFKILSKSPKKFTT